MKFQSNCFHGKEAGPFKMHGERENKPDLSYRIVLGK